MDYRKVFDSIPEDFDRWRPRYCDELFEDIIKYADLNVSKETLEIGPGTGQATEPILKTGCSYTAIELGEHLAEYTKNKFSTYGNFQIVNADFETYGFGKQKFDLVYSAATIQWIPESICFPKVYELLKSKGTFAMIFISPDHKTPNEALFMKMQEVYAEYFHPKNEYTCSATPGNVSKYGFGDYHCQKYSKIREYNADDYISLISTYVGHIELEEPHKSKFYKGIKEAILSFGNKIVLFDTIDLHLERKR